MEDPQIIAGIDEAGRGPLAGPVIAAAVILNPREPIEGLADSKQLSEKERHRLFDLIRSKSLAWTVGRASVAEIDTINILQASLLAMRRASRLLKIQPCLVLIDGNRCPEQMSYPVKAVIRGDETEPVISAASIVAKVIRDRLMHQLDKKYPQYGFAQHKGYGTKTHLSNLDKYGPCRIHRKSFAPVSVYFEEGKGKLSYFE